ncbi:DUF3820 family protein [Balneolales bacterium ANBcel1]|nr:DUF3820 family protein [Balneolales bacterium ANBcel1]
MEYDRQFLIRLVQARMPFGKYEGREIMTLPTNYLEYFAREGFPAGELGQYLSTMHEIRTNGLDEILRPIRQAVQRQRHASNGTN